MMETEDLFGLQEAEEVGSADGRIDSDAEGEYDEDPEEEGGPPPPAPEAADGAAEPGECCAGETKTLN